MADAKEYAYLGDVIFQPLSFTGIDERYCYQFAEHQVIEGKPLLQYVGDNLDELNLSIRFHFSFCDPSKEVKALKAAADKHTPLVLQFSDGTIAGRTVITELQKTTEVTADNGRVLSLDVRVTLKEWFDPEPIKSRQLKQKQNAAGLQSPYGVQSVSGLQSTPALQTSGALAKPVPAKQSALISAALKFSASVVGVTASAMGNLASGLSTVMSAAGPVIDQIKTAASGISAEVGPIMQEAQRIAAEEQAAATALQARISAIASYSSSVTRILSGLPGPAGKLGARIAAANGKISGEATKMITLTSLVQGQAVETGTRAQMITRMLPKKDVPQ